MSWTRDEMAARAGQELRDEFTCPITRALMRVPARSLL